MVEISDPIRVDLTANNDPPPHNKMMKGICKGERQTSVMESITDSAHWR